MVSFQDEWFETMGNAISMNGEGDTTRSDLAERS